MVADINDKKDFWKLVVKVVDKWIVVKDGKEHSEMIIVDAKVSYSKKNKSVIVFYKT